MHEEAADGEWSNWLEACCMVQSSVFLQDERNELRARERVLQTESELHEREARRFQHLYESEVRLREALASRLERVSENVNNVSRL